MSTITTKDGTEIFYKDWGAGQPIVFSHGWPLSADDWDAQMLFFLGKGQAKVIRQGRVLNMIGEGECFGEMAYIRAGRLPRRATVDSMTELLIGEFEPDAVTGMSLGAQLHLTRAVVCNLVDRLELANTATRG